MSGNKKQVMSETKISYDGEKVVTSVSDGRSNTTVTTTIDGVVISVAKEKTPQDVRDQGEQCYFNLDDSCVLNVEGQGGLYMKEGDVRVKMSECYPRKKRELK